MSRPDPASEANPLPTGRPAPSPWARWVVLAIGMAGQAASVSFVYGIPFLVPTLRQVDGLSLAQAGVVVAAPTVGLLSTLIVWGMLADRFGERWILAGGLGSGGAVVLVAAACSQSLVVFGLLLALAGALAASVNSTSGRVVLKAFPPSQRGAAMGIRQMSQQLGLGVASLVLPVVARGSGIGWALVVPGILCIVVAGVAACFLRERPVVFEALPAGDPGPTPPSKPKLGPKPDRGKKPEREKQPPSPYRQAALWRVHGASALLAIPQFAISAFTFEYLVSRRGWTPLSAGYLLAAVQVFGAAGRLGAGAWSDRVGSRLRPMRQLAVVSTVVMVAVAIGDAAVGWLAIAALTIGFVVTVADNGLGYTASAELAGPRWAGRALGAQNTAQNVAVSLTPPLLGALIGATSYSVAYGVTAIFPLIAIFVTPVAAEVYMAGRQTSRQTSPSKTRAS